MPEKEFVPPAKSVYNNDSSYPIEQVKIAHIGHFDCTNQIVSLEITPFKYNAKNNQLMFCSSFDIRIELEQTQNNKNILSKFKTTRTIENQKAYNEILRNMVDNPEDIEYKDSFIDFESAPELRVFATIPQELSYDYVVITNNALAPSFDRFVAWKKRKGINIGVVTMEYIRNNYSGDLISGIYDDAGRLRQFLFDAYHNNLMYVLLGGDKNTVPIRMGSSQNNPSDIESFVQPTDIYFADFDGDWNVDNDSFYGEPNHDSPEYIADIFVGRLLCSTPQHVENWTEKLIRYELNPGNGNFSYLKKAFYTQADQMQSGNWANTIKSTFSMFTTNTIFEETYNGTKNGNSADLPQFPTGADVINEFNNNYGLVSFMGHGAPCNVSVASKGLNLEPPTKHRIYTSSTIHPEYIPGGSVEGITNFAYPNINYSISCTTMPYDNAMPWHVNHEHLGNYFTINSKNGNVAYLGNTRNGWISSSRDLFRYFGEEINNGNYNLGIAEALSLYRTNDLDLKYSHNLLGCPEMEMWTDIPNYFNLASVSENGNNVTVNTGGVDNSTICIMSALDNGLSYFEVEKNASSATFTNVNKPYLVTITKHNYIPYLKNPEYIYIQNESIYSRKYIFGENIYAGDNITFSKPRGPVIIKNGSYVVFESDNETVLERGFSVELGGVFEVK